MWSQVHIHTQDEGDRVPLLFVVRKPREDVVNDIFLHILGQECPKLVGVDLFGIRVYFFACGIFAFFLVFHPSEHPAMNPTKDF